MRITNQRMGRQGLNYESIIYLQRNDKEIAIFLKQGSNLTLENIEDVVVVPKNENLNFTNREDKVHDKTRQ